MTDTVLDGVMPLQQFREKRQAFFPSRGSLDWYVRTHKRRLVVEGALLMMRGAWHVYADAFDKAILDIASDEAEQALDKSEEASTAQMTC